MSETPPTTEIVYVVYAPYLPLGERASIGEWELVPRGDLGDEDAVDPEVAVLARGFASLHELPARVRADVGAFARLRTGQVGDDPRDSGLIVDLTRALVVGVLESNESPLLPEEERDPNAGHRAMTSDNAMVVASGIKRDGGWTAAISGGRVRRIEGGLSVLHDDRLPAPPKIAPPGDLHIPVWPKPLDGEYASAAWESIRRGTDAARRLARAIDWLDLAWRNASAVTDDLRVPALRAGSEVLLDSGDVDVLRERLSELLDAEDAPVRSRHWTTLRGAPASAEMTDLAWWFTQFSFLRNELMHGSRPSLDSWLYEGAHQVDLGEWWLRQAIKETIARDGHADIREDPIWRDAFRGLRELTRSDPN
jgi:hypothetical protein